MKTMMLRPALIALCLSGLAACDGRSRETTTAKVDVDGASASVRADDAWCRPTPNGARVGACYLTLTAGQDDQLVSIDSPAAATAEVHDMVVANGMMSMSPMTDGLPLPRGEAQTLAPGGRHIMLMQLAAPLVEGERVPLTLHFRAAPTITVQAAVRQPEAAAS